MRKLRKNLALLGMLGLLAACMGDSSPAEPTTPPPANTPAPTVSAPLSVGATGGQIESSRHRVRLVLGAPEAAGQSAGAAHSIQMGAAATAAQTSPTTATE